MSLHAIPTGDLSVFLVSKGFSVECVTRVHNSLATSISELKVLYADKAIGVLQAAVEALVNENPGAILNPKQRQLYGLLLVALQQCLAGKHVVRCFKCKNEGHVQASCNNDRSVQVACRRCGMLSHTKRDCPILKNKALHTRSNGNTNKRQKPI